MWTRRVSIIAYTYEAGLHCPDCARARAERNGFELAPLPVYGKLHGLDEHDVPFDAIDDEGNPVHPVFSTDEVGHYDDEGRYIGAYCDTCGATIREPEPEPGPPRAYGHVR
jgi:hypothetical protein